MSRARPPLGMMRMLVCVIMLGTAMQSTLMSSSGMTAILGLFAKYFKPSAPKSAGTTLLNAGSRTSLCRTGCRGASRITPATITSVVTMALVATLIVEMI